MENHELNQRKTHNFQKTKIQKQQTSPLKLWKRKNSGSTVLYALYSAEGQKSSTQKSTPSKNIPQELGEINPLSDKKILPQPTCPLEMPKEILQAKGKL